MTFKDKMIYALETGLNPICDDCLGTHLGVARQQVYMAGRSLLTANKILRMSGECVRCSKRNKIVSLRLVGAVDESATNCLIGNQPPTVPSTLPLPIIPAFEKLPVIRTQPETNYLAGTIVVKIGQLKEYVNANPSPSADASAEDWYRYISELLSTTGNTHNWASFVACLMAKDYLCRVLPMVPFDVSMKPQGAPGLDIDEVTVTRQRVIGEVKTTTPHLANDLGAQQRTSFIKDFDKLNHAVADQKFLFVTNKTTFDIIKSRYAGSLRSVKVVLLPAGTEFETV